MTTKTTNEPLERLGRVVRIRFGAHRPKRRIFIVLRLDDDGVVAVTPTTVDHADLPSIRLDPGHRDANRIGLTKTSYFYARNVVVFPKDTRFEDVGKTCSPAFRRRLIDFLRPLTRVFDP